jgi:hypothetical protein
MTTLFCRKLSLATVSVLLLSSCESVQVKEERKELWPTAEVLNQASLEWQKHKENEVLASKQTFPLVTDKEFLIRVASIQQGYGGVVIHGRAGSLVAKYETKSFFIDCHLSDAAAKKLDKDPAMITVGGLLYVKGKGRDVSSKTYFSTDATEYEFSLDSCSFRLPATTATQSPIK